MDTIGKKLALKEKMAYGSPPQQLALFAEGSSSRCFYIVVLFSFYLSIILIDSIPTLPPRTTSIYLNSSLISLMTASFLVAVWTNSRRRLSFP